MLSTSLTFYHPFITGVLHGGHTWWFIKDLIHPWSLHQDSCWSSSILLLAFRSAILSTLSFEMVLCHPWQFLLVFHDSQVFKTDIFKSLIFCSFKRSFQPINLLLELYWVISHIQPSLRNVAICGAYQ